VRLRVSHRYNYIPCDDDVRNSCYFSRYYYALGLEGNVREVPETGMLFNTPGSRRSESRVTGVLVISRRVLEASETWYVRHATDFHSISGDFSSFPVPVPVSRRDR